MKFEKKNTNPYGKKTGDCSIRALSTALNVDYVRIYKEIFEHSLQTGEFIAFPDCFKSFLLARGIPDVTQKIKKGDKRMKVEDFTEGTFILQIANHFTAVVDGTLYDIWDCRKKSVYRYWKIYPKKQE